MEKLPLYAIIVAGGQGSRMNNDLPKQFIPIGGMPILMHTVKNFMDYSSSINIVLVLPKNQISTWENLCSHHHFIYSKTLTIVEGGDTRFQSVKNGLQSIMEEEGIVVIHDGVRPFISRSLISETIKTASIYGNAICSVPLKESIRMVEGETNKAMDRTIFKLIQTPQCFKLSLIKKAYESTELPFFTDDASVAENIGVSINLVEGTYENIKVTTPEDLSLADAILKIFKY